MEEQRLPSHNQLFAALLPPSPLPGLSIISDFADNPAAAEIVRETPSSAGDSNWRRQLLTLHVIFPSLLLPALDLLDRGLVTRLLVANESHNALERAASLVPPISIENGIPQNIDKHCESVVPDSWQATGCREQICMYTVQSAASNTTRRKRHAPQTAKVYVVHLDAWSCSCGGFALDAYSHYDVANNSEKLQNSAPPGWAGNWGLDRLASLEDFPCCKHLLACLLAEKWRNAPGGQVHDRYTTKEELAAIIGGS
ncbi:hypothetical protein V8C35DRAFT_316304 [Trichoderma chlorosporum]